MSTKIRGVIYKANKIIRNLLKIYDHVLCIIYGNLLIVCGINYGLRFTGKSLVGTYKI